LKHVCEQYGVSGSWSSEHTGQTVVDGLPHALHFLASSPSDISGEER
jgi:hypothetical protein